MFISRDMQDLLAEFRRARELWSSAGGNQLASIVSKHQAAIEAIRDIGKSDALSAFVKEQAEQQAQLKALFADSGGLSALVKEQAEQKAQLKAVFEGLNLSSGVAALIKEQKEAQLALRAVFAPFSEQAKQLSEAIKSTFSPFAREDFLRVLQRHENARLVRVLKKTGWLVGDHPPASAVPKILAMYDKSGAAGVDRFFCKYFRANKCRALKRMVATWDAVPYLAARRRHIREVVEAHERGLYALTTPTLYPFIDGVALLLEASVLQNLKVPPKNPRKWRSNPASSVGAAIAENGNSAADRIIGVLLDKRFYSEFDFRSSKRVKNVSNRHAVTHGQTTGYRNEATSLRIFLLLDAFARWYLAAFVPQKGHAAKRRRFTKVSSGRRNIKN